MAARSSTVMLELGQRVRVVRHEEWPEGITGCLAAPAPFQLRSAPGEWHGHRRITMGRTGMLTFYFVRLDEPHDDGSGDGPYVGGEIEDCYLEPLGEGPP